MASQEYARLAQTLPPRLLRFFARYPPSTPAASKIPSTSTISTAMNTSSSDPNAGHIETEVPSIPYSNPFTRTKHPITGKWHDPKFSLRHQADLCKLARSYGIEELLPPSAKSSEVRLKRRVEQGLRVRGTGVGQKVKGHKFERGLKQKLDKRREAMLKMPELVRTWKQLGHGRGWKKYPSK